AVEVVIHAAEQVDFFAGETVEVGGGQRAVAGDQAAERIITVFRDLGLGAVEHVGDVAVAIGVIIVVRSEVAAGVAVGTGQQAADSSSAFETAAEVGASGVADRGRIVGAVALLDDAIAVVE